MTFVSLFEMSNWYISPSAICVTEIYAFELSGEKDAPKVASLPLPTGKNVCKLNNPVFLSKLYKAASYK